MSKVVMANECSRCVHKNVCIKPVEYENRFKALEEMFGDDVEIDTVDKGYTYRLQCDDFL